MVNCFICESPFEKGVGVCCSRKCHNVRINSQRDYSKSKITTDMQDRIQDYDLNPVKCLHCDAPLSYHTNLKGYKFCNRSCGAKHVNLNRDPMCYKKGGATLRAKYDLLNRAWWPSSPVTFGQCKECDKVYRKVKGRLYCSDACKISAGIKVYRRSCQFKISKTHYPHLFNLDLLNQHGWYRASNHPKGYNPEGATWDHLFRVEDGFKLGVDLAIMRHPANAEMVSWRENFARKKSRITYAELLTRIEEFDKRYGGP